MGSKWAQRPATGLKSVNMAFNWLKMAFNWPKSQWTLSGEDLGKFGLEKAILRYLRPF